MSRQIEIEQNNYLRALWTGIRFRVYRHLVAITLVGLVLLNAFSPYREPYATYSKLVLFSMLMFVFYTNMYLLVPRLLFHNKYRLYLLGVMGYGALAYLMIFVTAHLYGPYMDPTYQNRLQGFKIVIVIFMVMMMTAASTAIKLFQRWIVDSARINELEKATMQSELEQLKNQINPHFLFNMLNSANVLTQRDPEKASQILMKLSDFLRYQLYDSTRPTVLLTADIHFLEDFLNLEKIRRDNFECIVQKEGDLSGVQVAPLLFIIFAENAVKYSLDPDRSTFVHLSFRVLDGILYFQCENSKPLIPARYREGGLGLANVKRRLELLYPGQHQLKIDETTDTFKVTLTITV